jgi:alkylation response protein AidB-like acyl-CoA dehydrogenase
MSSIADVSTRRLTEEQRAIAEVAFAIGANYADRRFDDHDASHAQWDELAASGLTGLSLPEGHGGAGGMLELCIACERLAAGGYPAAKLIISTAMAGGAVAPRMLVQSSWPWDRLEENRRYVPPSRSPPEREQPRTIARATGAGQAVTGEKTYVSAWVGGR